MLGNDGMMFDGNLRCDVLSNGNDVMVMSNDGVMVMMWWWRCDGGDNDK